MVNNRGKWRINMGQLKEERRQKKLTKHWSNKVCGKITEEVIGRLWLVVSRLDFSNINSAIVIIRWFG